MMMDKKTDVLINGEVVGCTSWDDYLMVEIPKKYKKGMEERWSLRGFEKENIILSFDKYVKHEVCALCMDFDGCLNCPFYKFKDKVSACYGCMGWLLLLGCSFSYLNIKFHSIDWLLSSDGKARKQMKEIRKKAKKYIKWI